MDLDDRSLVIRRALGLCALVCRGHMEAGAGDKKIEEMHELVLSWVIETGASEALERDEGLILVSPLGRLTRGEIARALFRAEQVAVHAWALGLISLTRHDEHPHDRFLAHRCAFLQRDAVERLERATPHSREHVLTYARRTTAILDRLKRFAIDGRPLDFVSVYELSGLPLAGGDLAIGGLPLAAAPEAKWKLALAAAVERDDAARWILDPTGAALRRPIDA